MSRDLSHFEPRRHPGSEPMEGRLVRLERTARDHLPGLFDAFSLPGGDENWTYLHYGPFADLAAFETFAQATYFGQDPCFYTVVSRASGKPLGVLALMRIDQANGVIEIGHVCLSPSLQRSREASEAFYLAMKRVFADLGYRRYEWKCDNANLPSRRAAERLGFTYEGLFRQHMIRKGVNRDTAWFSIIDSEWPAIDRAFGAYLDDANFDADGRQKRRLEEFRATVA